MKINKDLFSALKFDNFQISCVLKIRLGGPSVYSEAVTGGSPSPILTYKCFLKLKKILKNLGCEPIEAEEFKAKIDEYIRNNS